MSLSVDKLASWSARPSGSWTRSVLHPLPCAGTRPRRPSRASGCLPRTGDGDEHRHPSLGPTMKRYDGPQRSHPRVVIGKPASMQPWLLGRPTASPHCRCNRGGGSPVVSAADAADAADMRANGMQSEPPPPACVFHTPCSPPMHPSTPAYPSRGWAHQDSLAMLRLESADCLQIWGTDPSLGASHKVRHHYPRRARPQRLFHGTVTRRDKREG